MASNHPAVREAAGRPGGWRHPGWAWTVRYSGVVTVGWTVSGLLLGAALGGVYTLITGDWHQGTTHDELWLTLGLTVVAVVIAAWCLVAVLGRARVTRHNGTAYILRETAQGWARDDAAKFLAESRRQFARVIDVPGPATLDSSWGWTLDDQAERWDAKVNELAVAFRALHLDDDPSSPSGIFLWAWWSVATAFGMRVTAAERGLELDVWQRPSTSRTFQEAPVPWANRPHSFRGAGSTGLNLLEFEWPVSLTATPATAHSPAAGPEPAVLLIRVGRKEWGGIPDAGATPEPEPGQRYDLHIRDAAGACPSGKTDAVLHELRYDLPIGTIPWHDFPALVTASADWIVRRAGSLKGRALLLGTVIPPEVALGVGIRAGHAARSGWPAHLWPLMYDQANGGFVVPRLNLGTAALNERLATCLPSSSYESGRRIRPPSRPASSPRPGSCTAWPAPCSRALAQTTPTRKRRGRHGHYAATPAKARAGCSAVPGCQRASRKASSPHAARSAWDRPSARSSAPSPTSHSVQ